MHHLIQIFLRIYTNIIIISSSSSSKLYFSTLFKSAKKLHLP